MKTCEQVRPQLSEFVDGALPEGARAEISAHLDTCPECRGLGADLERLRGAARALGPITPPGHVWLEVAGRIRLEQGPVARSAASSPAHTRSQWQWLGLAAALVVVTLGVWMVQRAPVSEPHAPATAQSSADIVSQELQLAMQHYEKAITTLEGMAEAGDETLDPEISATLRDNLGVLDQAIDESRAALADNPESLAARDSLFEALRQKVGLLQATVTLMNEMRKGNPEGALAVTGRGRSL